MKFTKHLLPAALLLAFLLLLSSCATIAKFNRETFQRTVMLKARTQVLLGHADESYTLYSGKVDSILLEAYSIYAMEMGRAKNEQTINQWTKLIGDKKTMLTGFFSSWKKKDKMNDITIESMSSTITGGFDEILKLEGQKLKQ